MNLVEFMDLNIFNVSQPIAVTIPTEKLILTHLWA